MIFSHCISQHYLLFANNTNPKRKIIKKVQISNETKFEPFIICMKSFEIKTILS